MKLVIASFLKEKKISYYITEETMYFQCLFCYEKAEMDYNTSVWHCNKCAHNGTFFDLMQRLKEQPHQTFDAFKSIYNPKKEIYQIKKQFKLLIIENNKTPTEKKLVQLYNKVLDLIEEINIY
ncbi:hypothetical protein J2Y73_005183 [Peribacillus frigoritolerans]|uniref:hypothetical protein n=1 Tax=Peribacillus frigoritolerans TaxID=450367 RepID=UPI00209E8B4D|nr:hypothetical protein [Peribacillus frigoritolerans]MCP1495152.1 hypothetical protein [Peribacillus frigoritolerans]